MAVEFNHTVISALDRKSSALFLSEILGLPAPVTWGPFEVVTTANGVSLDFIENKGEIPSRHFAFLVSEIEFDQISSRIGSGTCLFGRTRRARKPAKSIIMTAAVVFISKTQTVTSWRSLRDLMAVRADFGLLELFGAEP